MKVDEKKLIYIVKPYILKCKSGDWEHAKKTVEWVKILGKDRDSLDLLIIAAYIHDIGWINVLPSQQISLKKLIEYEPEANSNTNKNAVPLLADLGYTKDKIKTILSYIKAADAHSSNTKDEAVIVDADNLSKLDISHIRNKFSKDSWIEVFKMLKNDFSKRIKTSIGKEIYPKLLKDLEKDINSKLIKND